MKSIKLGTFFILLQIIFFNANATKTCHQCSGINCQRTNYNRTEVCTNEMDICVTVFDGASVAAQGCYEKLSEDMRRKCAMVDKNDEMMQSHVSPHCHMCLSNLCNNVGPMGYMCIQCDSDKDERCRNDPAKFMPTQCSISRASNVYCYASDDGKRLTRGCAGMVHEQQDCLNRKNCSLCSPMEFPNCNVEKIIINDDENGGSGSGGNGNGGNGSGGTGSGGNGNGGNGNGGNGSNGGSGGNGGGNGSNGGGNGSNGGSGGNGGGSGSNGGSGGSGGGNGSNGGGSEGGGNSKGSTILLSFITFLLCFVALVLGLLHA